MAQAALAVGIIGLALQVTGGMDAAADARDIARRKRAAAEFEAGQLEQQAGQTEAASQRTRLEEDRQGRLVQSRAIALAAASGASASDPTVMKIVSGIASESAYRQNVALYEGEEKARQLRIGAAADRFSGDIGAAASLSQGRALSLQAAGSAVSSGSSMFARYGYGSPASNPNYSSGGTFTPRYSGGTAADPSYG